MKFSQIHDALTESAKAGPLKEILQNFFKQNDLLSLNNREEIEKWLYSVIVDDQPKKSDEDGLAISRIRNVYQKYCVDFINNNYYRKSLPYGYTPSQFIENCEFDVDYESNDEYEASEKIFDGLANYEYFEISMKSILEKIK